MLTLEFWKGAAERAVKTFIQSFVAALLASVGAAVTAWEVPWGTALSGALGIALLAAILSLATSVGNADFTAGRGPDGDLQVDHIDEITTVTKYKPIPGKHVADTSTDNPGDAFDDLIRGN